MGLLKKKFRNIRKLPTWLFIPIVLLIKLMKFLMRTEVIDPHERLRLDKYPYITITWHNRLLFFPVMFTRSTRKRTAALVSASRDGQYVADVVGLFGIKSVRGSTSRRAGPALHESLKCLKDGYNLSMTPDGPRGPLYKMSRGPVVLASKTGYPVVPMSINYTSFWEVKSWDRFQIPKPWAKIMLVVGDPIKIPPDITPEETEEWQRVLEQKLNAISMIEGMHPPGLKEQ
jgi:lysophospholipid acyltransferase (LPLAT)-like uncharacterized protein